MSTFLHRSLRIGYLSLGFLPIALGLVAPAASASDDPPPASSAPHPRMELPHSEIQAGRKIAGPPLEVAFPVRNMGDAVLHITDAQPDCGCVVASYDREIAPGETGSVTLTLRTDRIRGDLEKHVRLETDDPDQPTAHLTMRVTLVEVMSFDPAEEFSIPIQPGFLTVRELRITGREETPLVIEKIESSAPFLRARVVDSSPATGPTANKGESTVNLAVVIASDAPARAFSETLTLTTSSEHMPQVTIRIHGFPRGSIAVSPARLLFDRINALTEQQVTREIAFSRATPFRILNATSDTDSIRLEMSQEQAGRAWTVRVIYKGGWQRGTHTGVLHIETDDPQRPTIELPYQAEVY